MFWVFLIHLEMALHSCISIINQMTWIHFVKQLFFLKLHASCYTSTPEAPMKFTFQEHSRTAIILNVHHKHSCCFGPLVCPLYSWATNPFCVWVSRCVYNRIAWRTAAWMQQIQILHTPNCLDCALCSGASPGSTWPAAPGVWCSDSTTEHSHASSAATPTPILSLVARLDNFSGETTPKCKGIFFCTASLTSLKWLKSVSLFTDKVLTWVTGCFNLVAAKNGQKEPPLGRRNYHHLSAGTQSWHPPWASMLGGWSHPQLTHLPLHLPLQSTSVIVIVITCHLDSSATPLNYPNPNRSVASCKSHGCTITLAVLPTAWWNWYLTISSITMASWKILAIKESNSLSFLDKLSTGR